MKQQLTLTILFLIFGHSLFAQNNQPPNINNNIRTEVIKSTCSAVDKYYVFPDKGKSMAEALKAQSIAGKFDSLINPNDFAGEMQKSLNAISNDNHLRMEYDPQLW